jgi:Flp pilus assembly protein TadD
VIASHRWLGANTAAPLFYGQTKQVELIKDFLSSNVIAADVFALKRESTGETFRELKNGSQLTLMPGEELTAEVVVSNRKAAHSFAPEVRDLYEIWVAFEATDERGNVLMRSGFIKPDGMLDDSAHVYKAILLDEDARPITRHQIWLTNVVGYNNAIPAGRSDIARFRFRLPENPETRSGAPITLRAVVNYRRFVQEYTNYVLKRQNRKLTLPIVQMAESEVKIVPISPGSSPRRVAAKLTHDDEMREMQARRWNDYGIALLEQAQYGPAADAFHRASELNPADLNPLVSAAVAEMKTERFGLDRNQLSKAAELLDTALKRDPSNARARYVHALLLRSQGKPSEAVDELAKLALEYPRDREVARQLGQTLYALGRIAEAKRAFEAIVEVDPTDFGAYQFLSPIYQSEGNVDKATHARNLFLQWRDDPTASSIAVRFFAAHPQWTDERVLAHTHDGDSPPRPVLSGMLAAPEK